MQEAVELTKVAGGTTMGDVAIYMLKLYTELGQLTDEEWEKYCDDYEAWQRTYSDNFPGQYFEDCII